MTRRYPAYNDSGVDWLGEVPDGWGVSPLRYAIEYVESGTSVNATDLPAVADEIAVLKTSCVYSGYFDPEENKTVVPGEIDRVSCPLRADTLIVSRMNTPDLVGAAGYVEFAPQNIFLPDRLWQIGFKKASARFVHYWTCSPSYRDQVRVVCAGTSSSMQNLSQDDFKSFVLALPPLPEQTAIAAFLDRETAKIDALVAEQRRLIDLLREKRQAVISHAVTKGLNPNAQLKPSGIDWLGDVPEGWEVGPLKRFGEFGAGAGFPHEEQGMEGKALPFFKVNAIGKALRGDRLIAEVDTISVETAERLRAKVFPEGTIVFAKIGAAMLLGRIRVLPCPACMDNNMMGFTATQSNSVEYFRHLIGLVRFDLIANPGTVPSLNEGQIANLQVCRPPLSEQDAIAAYLDQRTEAFDTLTATAETAITLLHERRAALISAAVTGKIDVRHLAPQATEAA